VKVDWTSVVENISIVLSIVLIGAFILTAGWFIGSASAHNTRVQNDYEMTCIDKGGNVIYVAEVGEVCAIDD